MTRRGRAVLRTVAAVVLTASAVAVVLALRPQDEPAPARDERAASTALWSARRVPSVFVAEVARQRLAARVQGFAAVPGACMTVGDAGGDGEALARANGDLPLAPASTTKLLTGLVALDDLGPDHRFTTRALLDDGARLFLVGGGDPVLTTPDGEVRLRSSPRTRDDVVTPLAALADEIAADGVTSITEIVVDDSRHDTLRFLPEWKSSYLDDVGPVGALVVDGGFTGGQRASDPARHAAEELAALLTARGVAVGGTSRGAAPTSAADAREVATVTSPALAEIVASMIRSSDNLTAEVLVRELAHSRGRAATTSEGVAALREGLDALGIPTAGLDLRDGSGLAAANRVTCDALLATLDRSGQPDFAALDTGLAVAGRTGTLVNRFAGDPLAGVLRAKTGQIDDVAGLAGVVDDAERLRFAYLVNADITEPEGHARQAEAAAIVASYPEAPPAAELVPAP